MMRITRQDSEEVVSMLAEKYPKCFFEDPKMRRPLKFNIIADLQQDGFPVAPELLSAGVDWYQSHFGYQHALQAGAKRIDLNGKEVGTVTKKEQDNAQKKIRDDQQKRISKTQYATAPIPDELDPSSMKRIPTVTPAPTIAPQLARLYEAFMAANAALLNSGDAALRSAMAAAALEFMVKEAQRVIQNSAEEIGDERHPLSGR
jgi:sRNA-binding protein